MEKQQKQQERTSLKQSMAQQKFGWLRTKTF